MKKRILIRINFSLDVKETDFQEVSDMIGKTFIWLLNTLGAIQPEVFVAETKPFSEKPPPEHDGG